MKILILANSSVGLYRFRRELIEELVKENDVYVDIPDDEYRDEIKKLKCKVNKNCYLNRRGTNPIQDLRLLNYYKSMIQYHNPDVVLTYTIKPNVYGGMACARYKVPYIVNITGLGTAIENRGLLQNITLLLYKYGLRNARKVFFQNNNNQNFMINHKIIKTAYEVLPGSGVNTEEFFYVPYSNEKSKIVFLTIGRIMRDKGIDELLSAAEMIKQTHSNLEFRLIGDFDENYRDIVEEYHNRGVINYLGSMKDVRPFIAESHAIIHPSYHEGMSNVLLEAASIGRPVIATDIPGCKEAFDDNLSGISFEPRDVESLVKAIEAFLKMSSKEHDEMGKAGRKKMEKQFSRTIVVDKYMEEIKKIGATR